MIKEAYVSFKTAKLLKEKGFDWDCEHYYKPNGEIVRTFHIEGSHHINSSVLYEHQCLAPTLAMAMKWLRKKGWHIVILFDYRYVDEKLAYIPVITPMKAGDAICLKQGGFTTYEEAVEAALKYCLTELI